MKKTIILFVCIAFIACNKNGKDEQGQSKNTVVWAQTAQSTLNVAWDSALCSKEYFNEINKIDKPAIFNSIKNAVLSGKLKAYLFMSEKEMTIDEFKGILVRWDSTNVTQDVNNPGTMVSAPIKYELKPEDIVQMRFDERMEYDTISNTLNKKVNSICFIKNKINNEGQVMGMAPLFVVKFPNGNVGEAKK